MSPFSDLELINEDDQAHLLGICGLCSSYKSLSPHTTATAGAIMFASLFDSHSAVELAAFVHFLKQSKRVLLACSATLH